MPRGATHVEIRVNRHGVKGVAPAKVHVVVGPVLLACGVVANPGTWAHQTSTVEAGAGHVFRLPVRGAPFQVRLTVDPTFSPAEYGRPTRGSSACASLSAFVDGKQEIEGTTSHTSLGLGGRSNIAAGTRKAGTSRRPIR